jgi:Flp pilus assembly protein TadB
VIPSIVLGVVAGLAGTLTWRALVPPAPPLAASLRRLEQAGAPVAIVTTEGGDRLAAAVGRRTSTWITNALEGIGLDLGTLHADLRLVGRSVDQHMGTKVVLAILGLLLPSATVAVAALGGVAFSFTIPVVAGLVLGVAFFFVPDLTLRSEAAERRKAFRHALSSFLDLVVISLAGGAGVESALRDAAGIGEGWAFTQLRSALDVTMLTGETPWSALGRLGQELGVAELAELAASVSLAGTEGARVRESLAAKAKSLRDHELSEAEAEAQSATERMALPVVLLFLGFLILIGFPAVDAVLTGI